MSWLVPGTVSAAQAPAPANAYVDRGHETEARQQAYHERMERVHQALAGLLRRAAPDLLPRLEPTPPTAFGYGILPRIVPDAPPPPPARPQVVRFSWVWSDTLIARENAALDRLEASLARVAAMPAPASRAACETLVADYKTRVNRRRPIDADVDYNWLWQKRIADNRPLFDRQQARLDTEVRRQAQPGPAASGRAQPAIGFDPPPFVRIEEPAPREHLVTLPLYTDITDRAVVRAFVEAVETRWRARAGQEKYRVRVAVTTFTPDAAPAIGEKIDLAVHAGRFPEDGAVLTTGAASVQVAGSRALVLGPHDVSPRTLAHEFGHLLGFPDAYLRGYRDLGADGFEVLELVADQADIMSSIPRGSVLARHFQGLIAATEIQSEMQAGLAALYQRHDAVEAVARFRAVLARNPEHFGATLQLAKALDQAGLPDEALPVWKRMLEMAEAAHNAETAATARARLAAER